MRRPRGRRMVRDPCIGRRRQISDDADDFVPAARFRAVQPLAIHCTNVPETAAERVAAGSDGVGEVAIDNDRIRPLIADSCQLITDV